MKNLFMLVTAVALLSGCAAAKTASITNFAECVAAGRPIIETQPRRCRVIGQIFVEEVSLQPSNFAECAAAGHPVMESHPRKCRVNGQIFVEELAIPVQPL